MAILYVVPLQILGLAIQLPDWLGITAALVTGGALAILMEKFRKILLFKSHDIFFHAEYPE